MTAADSGGIGAILLAGGRGSRMGGVHKPLLEVGGITLLDAATAAARDAGAEPIIAVGPAEGDDDELVWVREDPPFGGPAAAILAALPRVTAPQTLVLACDLARPRAAVRALLTAEVAGDGVCLLDSAGRPQWLTGLYRTDALRTAAGALPDRGRNASVRALLGDLPIAGVAGSDEDDAGMLDLAFDIDTWDDLNEARRRSP
jgi:molybdopterin-guanine dinucleotide biosynthesis protein A